MGDWMQVNGENVEGHFVLGTAFFFLKNPSPPTLFCMFTFTPFMPFFTILLTKHHPLSHFFNYQESGGN
jgi:hypothetical protein